MPTNIPVTIGTRTIRRVINPSDWVQVTTPPRIPDVYPPSYYVNPYSDDGGEAAFRAGVEEAREVLAGSPYVPPRTVTHRGKFADSEDCHSCHGEGEVIRYHNVPSLRNPDTFGNIEVTRAECDVCCGSGIHPLPDLKR